MSGTIVARCDGKRYECEIAKTIAQKMHGLMFSKKKNIIFIIGKESIFGIHSFFVFFPFDAIYLDLNGTVTEIKRQVSPFTFYVCNSKPAGYLLEICEKNDLKEGDRIECELFGMENNKTGRI